MIDIILGVLLIVAAVFLVIAVLFQSGKSKVVSGTISGGNSETYFGKNKGKSLDKKLSLLTAIVAIVFMVIVLVVYVSQPYTDFMDWFLSRITTSAS